MSDTPKLFVWGRDGMKETGAQEELSYVMRQAHERIVHECEQEINAVSLEYANALGTAAAEADARKRNLARAQELERQLAQSDILYAQVLLSQRNLKHALMAAVDVIKTWHNLNFPERLYPEKTWHIYYENAPEMKAIREALK